MKLPNASELKPYPEMRDSGVEWLGKVPAHWEVRRLKLICRLVYGDALATEIRQEGKVPVFGSNGRVGFHSSANTKAPCIVVGRKGSFGKVNYSRDSVYAIDTTFFIDSRFSGAHIRWLFFLLGWLRLDEVTKDSAVPGLDREDAYQRLAPVPPLPEQAGIVRFLDHAGRRIRRYILAKQKLITLLQEQKQAIIHQAVTGQIDVRTGQPYPSYKPSGVEWLDDVPEHWEVLPLKRAFVSMNYGISDSGSDAGTIGLLTMGNIRDGEVTVPRYGGVTYVDPSLLLQDRDILFNRTNSSELVAKVGLFHSKGRPVTFASYLVRMRTRPENSPEFLNLLLNDAEFMTIARREAIPSLHQSNLNPTRYGRLKIPLPPPPEQEAIVQGVTEGTSSVNAAVVRTNREINHLLEYLTRLVADVVIGKLDVREAAARLPTVDKNPPPDGPPGEVGPVHTPEKAPS